MTRPARAKLRRTKAPPMGLDEACRILEQAGLLTALSRCGKRVKYRITRGAECLVQAPAREAPSEQNRPSWAYDGVHEPDGFGYRKKLT